MEAFAAELQQCLAQPVTLALKKEYSGPEVDTEQRKLDRFRGRLERANVYDRARDQLLRPFMQQWSDCDVYIASDVAPPNRGLALGHRTVPRIMAAAANSRSCAPTARAACMRPMGELLAAQLADFDTVWAAHAKSAVDLMEQLIVLAGVDRWLDDGILMKPECAFALIARMRAHLGALNTYAHPARPDAGLQACSPSPTVAGSCPATRWRARRPTCSCARARTTRPTSSTGCGPRPIDPPHCRPAQRRSLARIPAQRRSLARIPAQRRSPPAPAPRPAPLPHPALPAVHCVLATPLAGALRRGHHGADSLHRRRAYRSRCPHGAIFPPHPQQGHEEGLLFEARRGWPAWRGPGIRSRLLRLGDPAGEAAWRR